MISINTNLSSIIVQKNLKTSTNKLNEAIERMSTGAKLNHASDNAANYSISTNMNTKLSSLQVAQDNVGMGLDMVTTASESLNLVTDQLTRIRALAEQAANGTYGGQSLEAINSEANARLKECARIINTAEYNGISLFKGATLGEADAPNRVSQAESLTAGETYSIKNSADLVALQNFVNDGVDTTNITFNLVDDINMSGVTFRGIGTDDTHAFKGTFNGNDYTISNLTINTTEKNVGFFGATKGYAKINDLTIENANITGYMYVAGLIGKSFNSNTKVTNCHTTGIVNGQPDYNGGIAGDFYGNIDKCTSSMTINSGAQAGGIVGRLFGGGVITNCYTTGDINCSGLTGGIVAWCDGIISDSYSTRNKGSVVGSDRGTIKRCYSFPNTIACYGNSGSVSLTAEEIQTASVMESYGFTEENGWYFDGGLPQLLVFKPVETENMLDSSTSYKLQVGINADKNSQISMDFSFSINLSLSLATHEKARTALSTLDGYIQTVANQQTIYGAVQNRLESALEANATQISNLTSSRSTIQDADIAKESSKYIKQQILQQACATLLATANQTPAIALQLL